MHAESHQPCRGLHSAEKIDGKVYQLHGGYKAAVLKQTIKMYMLVVFHGIEDFRPVLFTALIAYILVCRVGVEIYGEIIFDMLRRYQLDFAVHGRTSVNNLINNIKLGAKEMSRVCSPVEK